MREHITMNNYERLLDEEGSLSERISILREVLRQAIDRIQAFSDIDTIERDQCKILSGLEELDKKIDEIDTDINIKIEGLDDRLDKKIDEIDTDINIKIEGLDDRIEKLINTK